MLSKESTTIAKFENSELEFEGYQADQFAESWNKIRYAKYFKLKPQVDELLRSTRNLIVKRDEGYYKGEDVEMLNLIIVHNLHKIESLQTQYLHNSKIITNMAMKFLADNDFKKHDCVWIKCKFIDEI